MQLTKTLRALLVLSSLIAIGIGAALLLDPNAFHASNGIELPADASLLSEVRAPGAALLVLGALMGVGVFARSFTFASTAIAAAVYLAYGGARLVSLALDGVPAPGLLGATALELAVGAACAAALVRGTRRTRAAVPSLAHPSSLAGVL